MALNDDTTRDEEHQTPMTSLDDRKSALSFCAGGLQGEADGFARRACIVPERLDRSEPRGLFSREGYQTGSR